MKLQQLLPLALSALPFLVHAAPSRDRSEAVREAFLHSWNGYKTYAWGADELKPVTKKGGNSRYTPIYWQLDTTNDTAGTVGVRQSLMLCLPLS